MSPFETRRARLGEFCTLVKRLIKYNEKQKKSAKEKNEPEKPEKIFIPVKARKAVN